MVPAETKTVKGPRKVSKATSQFFVVMEQLKASRLAALENVQGTKTAKKAGSKAKAKRKKTAQIMPKL